MHHSPLHCLRNTGVSKHIGTLVWWRISNRGRLKRFDALIKYVIWPMSDRVELARDIAARTKPRSLTYHASAGATCPSPRRTLRPEPYARPVVEPEACFVGTLSPPARAAAHAAVAVAILSSQKIATLGHQEIG